MFEKRYTSSMEWTFWTLLWAEVRYGEITSDMAAILKNGHHGQQRSNPNGIPSGNQLLYGLYSDCVPSFMFIWKSAWIFAKPLDYNFGEDHPNELEGVAGQTNDAFLARLNSLASTIKFTLEVEKEVGYLSWTLKL